MKRFFSRNDRVVLSNRSKKRHGIKNNKSERLSVNRGLTLQSLETRRLMIADAISNDLPRLDATTAEVAMIAPQSIRTQTINERFTAPRIVNGRLTSEFEAVGIVNDGCTGTLVSPTHVLTAAHCTEGQSPNRMSFQVGGQTYRVTNEVKHPKYNDAQFDVGYDLAIMQLDRPVVGIDPMNILRTVPKVGDTLTLVGFGEGGKSGSPSPGDFGTKRVGQTAIDEVTPTHISWTFESGESNTAPGDSGGPAFVSVDGEFRIAGVTSGGDGDAHTLGDFSFDTRIDPLAGWIDSIVNQTTPVPTDPAPDEPDPTDPSPSDPSPTDPIFASGDDHADEIGSQATPINIEDGVALGDGSFETTDDTDVFSLTVSEPGSFEIELYGQDKPFVTSLVIVDDQGETITVSDNHQSGDSIASVDLDEGVYYVIAQGDPLDSGEAYFLDIYQIAFDDIDVVDEPIEDDNWGQDDWEGQDLVDGDGTDPQVDDDFWGDESWNDGDWWDVESQAEWSDELWSDDEEFHDPWESGDWWDLQIDPSLDCNRDHRLTALDALVVLNHLNLNGSGSRNAVSMQFDANGDSRVTTLDALTVINNLNYTSQANDAARMIREESHEKLDNNAGNNDIVIGELF